MSSGEGSERTPRGSGLDTTEMATPAAPAPGAPRPAGPLAEDTVVATRAAELAADDAALGTIARDAREAGFRGIALRAELAAAEQQLVGDAAAARAALRRVEAEAKQLGQEVIARRARALAQR